MAVLVFLPGATMSIDYSFSFFHCQKLESTAHAAMLALTIDLVRAHGKGLIRVVVWISQITIMLAAHETRLEV